MQIVLLVPEGSQDQNLSAAIEEAGMEPRTIFNPESVVFSLAHVPPTAILLDSSFLESRGTYLIETLRAAAPETPIILLVDAAKEQLRLKALILGVEDCVARPCSVQEIVLRLCRVLDKQVGIHRMSHEIQNHRDQSYEIRNELTELRQ